MTGWLLTGVVGGSDHPASYQKSICQEPYVMINQEATSQNYEDILAPRDELEPTHEQLVEYISTHPEDYSDNLSLVEKIQLRLAYLKKKKKSLADAEMDKRERFKKLDASVEQKQNETPLSTTNDAVATKMKGANRLDEVEVSRDFIKRIDGDYLFNKTSNQWHHWNGKCWEVDNRGTIKKKGISYVAWLYSTLVNYPEDDRVKITRRITGLNSKMAINNIIDLASYELVALEEDFNTNEHILNVRNGTIEFIDDNGQSRVLFREHRKEDMCSFMAEVDYNPSAEIPEIWTNHVNVLMREDAELIKNLQFVLGYCLEGGNPLERFLFFIGAGRNGKSVTLRVFLSMLGTYGLEINPLSLMESGNKGFSPERRKMRGKRFILAQETKKPEDKDTDTSTFDSGFVKTCSGRDKFSARDLHKNNVEEFYIKGLITLSTNALPKVNDTSTAFWDRIIIVPFHHYFEEDARIADQEEQLKEVSSGILNWLLHGWEESRRSKKFVPCESVKDLIEEYQSHADEFSLFIRDCIIRVSGGSIGVMDLYVVYQHWCNTTSQMAIPEKVFTRKMSSRFAKKRITKGIVYLDIVVKPDGFYSMSVTKTQP